MTDKTENTFFSDTLDGAQSVVGLKDDVTMNSFGKRLGALLPGVAGGMFIQGALTRKGLRSISETQANAVVDATPGGAITVRKL